MNVVVLSPNWLGDAVMALPALADVRRHFAGARLAVAARGSVAELFRMVDGVDEVLTLPGRGGMAAIGSWRSDVDALGSGGFDLAVLLPNSFASAWVTRRAGIAERWGFAADWRTRLLTRAVPKPGRGLHHAAYYQALVEGLGMATGPRYASVRSAGTLVRSAGTLVLASPYVVFAPGAAYGRAKQWPPERFAELADLTIARGWRVVLVGSKADADVCASIHRAVRTRSVARDESIEDLSGRTTLAELAAVLAHARAVVSNDSGAMHLAGAVGARVLAIFGATNEHGTSPLSNGPDAPPAVILTTQAWCRPCMLRECPIDHRCMTGVTAQAVSEALS